MSMPNFLVIGAPKSGTSSINYYLKQHPEIGMCQIKEPNFFVYGNNSSNFKQLQHDTVDTNARYQLTLEEYQQLFSHITTECAVGDVSPAYMHPGTAAHIHRYIPNAKIIAILRNPIDQAYSSFCHLLRDEREVSGDFVQLLSADTQAERMNSNWPGLFRYLELGRYEEHLTPYFNHFPKEQILVLLFDDFAADTLGVMQKLYDFLDVDPTFLPDVSKKNRSDRRPSKSISLYRKHIPQPVRAQIKKWFPSAASQYGGQKTFTPPPLSPEAREILRLAYIPHNKKLEELLGIDLTQWIDR